MNIYAGKAPGVQGWVTHMLVSIFRASHLDHANELAFCSRLQIFASASPKQHFYHGHIAIASTCHIVVQNIKKQINKTQTVGLSFQLKYLIAHIIWKQPHAFSVAFHLKSKISFTLEHLSH